MLDLRTFITLASLAGAAGMYLWPSGDAKRLTAADAMIGVMQADLVAAKSDLRIASEINEANIKALKEVMAERDRLDAIAAQAQAVAAKRAADLQTALKRIRHAPKSDDGPVAPVLRRELDDLRSGGVRPVGNDAGDAPAGATGEAPSGAPADQPVEPTVSPAPPTS